MENRCTMHANLLVPGRSIACTIIHITFHDIITPLSNIANLDQTATVSKLSARLQAHLCNINQITGTFFSS